MCGEIDDQTEIGQDLKEHMRVLARVMELGSTEGKSPRGLASEDGRAAYMNAIFRDGLARAMADVASAEEAEAVDAIASQAIALARLAGFLAGQLPPEADLFRALIEATSAGHAEPRAMAEERRAQHHGHHHDSDHHHDHTH
jgi:hypothetical protein